MRPPGDNGQVSDAQTPQEPVSSTPGPAGRKITGKQARDLNDVIRYTAWSVFRSTRPQGSDRASVAAEVDSLFEQFKDLQPGEHGVQSYAQIGAALGLTEQAVKNARHTFNRRYAELLRQEVAQTISDPAELEAEIQHFMRVLGNR